MNSFLLLLKQQGVNCFLALFTLIALTGCYTLKPVKITSTDVKHFTLVEKGVPFGSRIILIDNNGKEFVARYQGASQNAVLGYMEHEGVRVFPFDTLQSLTVNEKIPD